MRIDDPAAHGEQCIRSIRRALMPWGEWVRDWDTREPIPADERRKWRAAGDEAEQDAVDAARRAAAAARHVA